MKTNLLVIITIVILFSMYVLMHAPIYPNPEQCDAGFEHHHFGYCGSNLFVVIPAYAVPYISPESNFENSKYVLVGRILSVEILSQQVVQKTENMYSENYGFALYEIEVEKYLKNPISNSTIRVLGQYTNEKHSVTYVTKPYEVKQTVLLYLQDESHIPGYDLMIRSSGSKVIDKNSNLTCKDVGCTVMTEETVCGAGTVNVKGTCQVIKTERMKTIGDDAPFFGIFAYLDDLISWILGK